MKLFAVILVCAASAGAACAQDAKKQIQRYQQMIAEGSPVELFELEGEALWKKPAGPRQASLEKCDLGLGSGVLKGAYARLPRYFADADRVMDLEQRLLWCMQNVQGLDTKDVVARRFSAPGRASSGWGAPRTSKPVFGMSGVPIATGPSWSGMINPTGFFSRKATMASSSSRIPTATRPSDTRSFTSAFPAAITAPLALRLWRNSVASYAMSQFDPDPQAGWRKRNVGVATILGSPFRWRHWPVFPSSASTECPGNGGKPNARAWRRDSIFTWGT